MKREKEKDGGGDKKRKGKKRRKRKESLDEALQDRETPQIPCSWVFGGHRLLGMESCLKISWYVL